ncbi:hypothetical protein MTO96_034510 [Rhipicephalus appendiculatus]
MATFRSVIVPRPKSEEESAVPSGEALERESSGSSAGCDARVGVFSAYISGNEKTADSWDDAVYDPGTRTLAGNFNVDRYVANAFYGQEGGGVRTGGAVNCYHVAAEVDAYSVGSAHF